MEIWKRKEEVSAEIRNKNSYKHVVSANMLIKKEVFININSTVNFKGYGLDNFFGSQLKQNHNSIFHINNEVYHLGIEKSIDYINKKEQAADTLLRLVKENKITKHSNSLLRLFLTLKRFGLTGIPAFIYKKYSISLKENLTGNNPSTKLLQLYRISYMCYSYKNN